MPAKDFEFYVGGIEDGSLGLLKAAMTPIGVKSFETYSGQLDNETLKKAIASSAMKFPLVMVSYADGENFPGPATSRVLGQPNEYEHRCSFAVIVASNDPRGEKGRRRGVLVGDKKTGAYTMIAAVLDTLTDVRLTVEVEGHPVLLNTMAFLPAGVDYLYKMPNITAYAVIFDTAFRWTSKDRQGTPIDVTDLILDVDSLNDPAQNPGNLPGVVTAVGS